jgi:hypothetical protein
VCSDLAKKLLALVELEKMNSASWMHLRWAYGLLDLSIGHNHLFTGHILLLNHDVSQVLSWRSSAKVSHQQDSKISFGA